MTLRLLLAWALMLDCSAHQQAAAQGCSQCRDQIGQTPERTQSAYRRGIVVLVIAACFVCGATVLVAKRFR